MSEFRIDLLNASGAIVGDGPLVNVLELNDTQRLDALGEAKFTIPAEDPRSALIVAGAQFDLYDRVDGYLGRFYYAAKELRAENGQARLVVSCWNQLIELARQSVYFRRTYTYEDVATVIADLVDAVSGWTATVDAGIGSTTVSYEGESVLLAVDVLRDRWNKHYRLGETRELEFGTFGDDSGIVLANLRGQVQANIQANTNVALVETIQLVEEADEIFNYIVPLGAGQGVAQQTIQDATLGTYTVQTGVNDDSSNYYYIADATSIVLYGQRDKVLSFPQIRPITNSDANITNAANALKLTAEAYIARHLAPKVTYAVTVRGLRQTAAVGDTVRLQYRGIVDGYAFVDVDADFYVMDVERRRNQDGTRGAVLTIATLAERRTSDTDIVLEVINDIRALKVHIATNLSKDRVGPYTLRIDSTHNAEFTVFFGDEVLLLNYAKLRFRTSTLKSSVTSASTAASSVATSSSDTHTHSLTASGSHTHTLTVSSSGSHSHTLTVTSTGLGSSGASSTSSSAAGSSHTHNLTIVYKASPEGVPVYYNSTNHYLNGTIGLGSDDTQTSSSEATHTHNIAHTHNIDHGHSGSTADAQAHTHTGQTTDAATHDHTINASGAHTHSVTVPSHTHTLTYGIYADTTYPQGIYISIDGGDITVDEGGPWGPSNASVEIEIDITNYLIQAAGGLRQVHRVLFSATTQGEIECEVNMLTTIQAIAVV